jgi:hypothetical protein
MHDQIVKAENGQTNGDAFDQTAEATVALAPKNYCGGIPSTGLFIAKYNQYPCILDCETASDDIQFHVTTIVQALAKRFKYNAAKDTMSRDFHRRTKRTYAVALWKPMCKIPTNYRPIMVMNISLSRRALRSSTCLNTTIWLKNCSPSSPR